jgi:GTP-binding protein
VNGFVDETTIHVSSGNGGNGAATFRREKYVPRGGPDGGDGGKGGDVVFRVRKNLKTLAHLKLKRIFNAESGKRGSGNKKHGRDGADAEILVPPGTRLWNKESGESLADLTDTDKPFVLLRGGKGGKGNSHFATPTNRAPRYAEEGVPGGELDVRVELHLIADIGLVGMPNAGKSTLLSVLTNATPRIGDYPFTTKSPNLGILKISDSELILADIPGIIEGASDGRGLGLQFLRHIDRCSALLFLVELGPIPCGETLKVLENELRSYSKTLAAKPRIVVGTKLDVEGARERLAEIVSAYPGERVLGVSSHSREGIAELAKAMMGLAGKSR